MDILFGNKNFAPYSDPTDAIPVYAIMVGDSGILSNGCGVCCEEVDLFSEQSPIQTSGDMTMVCSSTFMSPDINVNLSYNTSSNIFLSSGISGFITVSTYDKLELSISKTEVVTLVSQVFPSGNINYSNKYDNSMGSITVVYLSGFNTKEELIDNYNNFPIYATGVPEIRNVPIGTELWADFNVGSTMSGNCEGKHSLHIECNIVGHKANSNTGIVFLSGPTIKYERCIGYEEL